MEHGALELVSEFSWSIFIYVRVFCMNVQYIVRVVFGSKHK